MGLTTYTFFSCSQHLNNLLENYLEPLKKETFLSNAEINALFGNIQEIVTFQRQFLQNLEEALELEPDFHKFEHSSQFKVRSPNVMQHACFLLFLKQNEIFKKLFMLFPVITFPYWNIILLHMRGNQIKFLDSEHRKNCEQTKFSKRENQAFILF